MLFHGRYFKRGTKRMLEELESLPINELFVDNIKGIVTSKDVSELRTLSKSLLLYAEKNLIHEKNNVFASFINMCNLQYIFTENRNMQQVAKIYFNVRLIYCFFKSIRIY